MVEEYLEKYAKPKKRSAGEDERILRKDILPKWGRRKAKDIRRRDVVKLLDTIVERGAPIGANRSTIVSITYDGQTYNFLHAQKIDFLSWDLLIELHDDARILLREVVDNAAVAGISGTIPDPYA